MSSDGFALRERQAVVHANGFGALEAWRVSANNALPDAMLTNTDEDEREAAGDVLILERVEKSQRAVCWRGSASSNGSGFVQQTLGRFVE